MRWGARGNCEVVKGEWKWKRRRAESVEIGARATLSNQASYRFREAACARATPRGRLRPRRQSVPRTRRVRCFDTLAVARAATRTASPG